MFGKKRDAQTPVKLDNGPLGNSAMSLAQKLVDVGIGGKAGFDPAEKVARDALAKHNGNADKAIEEVIGDHRKMVAANGFLTGLGGFVTMVVALPANVAGFYVAATRMVAAVAAIRGYDLRDPKLRSAVLLTLVGADADDVLRKAGVVATGRLASMATQQLPAPVLMVVNKAVGFRLIGQLGEKFATRLGKAIPLAGGFIGAGLDVYLLRKIADNAKTQFPPATQVLNQPR
ncbi:EcsC family protein [Calidifontibacter sp. DB0510]|uniref:EcsC family protein n=1 Tax=Metallococcus carri TaxID=1656884 RepID=A0A967B2F7_9MICO|nr:EcsC family protein [Metallococcus carri]NHN56050.1 EcsC family protein [Metallococcus carri]NOP37493.1 EcsC family protein [Calidifontibacter sp. DB2511S]